MNQLLRENNQKTGKTWTWTYDDGGNIRSKSEYTYTTGDLGTATDTISYAYGDSDWGDLLTSYDGKAITYDGVGNMLRNGVRSYTWKHGRQLNTLGSWEFTYNADGLRTKRVFSDTGIQYQYYYSGSQLVKIDFVDDYVSGYMTFTYDANGVPLSAKYDMHYYEEGDYYDDDIGDFVDYVIEEDYDGTFYYVTNLQGDVVALIDESGNLMVEYAYDAWGKPLTTRYYNDCFNYAYYNPFRYRGYIYDADFKLYYLQSRYYDPEIGRFINADGLVSTGQGLLGNNMFVYCLNNPIVCADDQGLAAILLLDIYGPSHIGIMAQDENGAWWHFYWGAAPGRDQAICALGIHLTPVTWCVEYSGELTLSAINDSGQFSGDYESMTYIPGDFSACIDEMKNPSEMYHLYFNNCSQKSLEILAIAETEYQSIFVDASKILIPSTAYTYVTVGIALTKVKNKINFKSLLPKRPISFPIKGGTHASCI